jgi:hypothetical protein
VNLELDARTFVRDGVPIEDVDVMQPRNDALRGHP